MLKCKNIRLLLFSFMLFGDILTGQIKEEFYNGFMNFGFSSQPFKRAIGIQFFEFSWYHNKSGIDGGIIWEVRTRALPELVGKGNFYDGTTCRSFAEWRVGYNIKSRDKYNWGLMWNPLNIWSVNQNGSRKFGFATTGMSIKIDYLLLDNIVLRYIFSPDFGIKKSFTSAFDHAFVLLNSIEFVTPKRLFFGFDLIRAIVSYDNEENDVIAKRFEIRAGIRLF